MSAPTYLGLTAQEILALPSITVRQAAFCLNYMRARGAQAGEPDPRPVRKAIREGRLPVIDAKEPITRWRIAGPVMRSYMGLEDSLALASVGGVDDGGVPARGVDAASGHQSLRSVS